MQRPLVDLAGSIPRERALARGYLKKRTSKGTWQRRYFLILPSGRGSTYFAYAKTDAPRDTLLASLDLAQSGPVSLLPEDKRCFGLQWDKHRVFMAASAEEAAEWVETMRRVQVEAAERRQEWGSTPKRQEVSKTACCVIT